MTHKQDTLKRKQFTIIKTIETQIHHLKARVFSNIETRIATNFQSRRTRSQNLDVDGDYIRTVRNQNQNQMDYPPEGLAGELSITDFDKADLPILLCFLGYASFLFFLKFLYPTSDSLDELKETCTPHIDIDSFDSTIGPQI